VKGVSSAHPQPRRSLSPCPGNRLPAANHARTPCSFCSPPGRASRLPPVYHARHPGTASGRGEILTIHPEDRSRNQGPHRQPPPRLPDMGIGVKEANAPSIAESNWAALSPPRRIVFRPHTRAGRLVDSCITGSRLIRQSTRQGLYAHKITAGCRMRGLRGTAGRKAGAPCSASRRDNSVRANSKRSRILLEAIAATTFAAFIGQRGGAGIHGRQICLHVSHSRTSTEQGSEPPT